jgi:hypothetical protein
VAQEEGQGGWLKVGTTRLAESFIIAGVTALLSAYISSKVLEAKVDSIARDVSSLKMDYKDLQRDVRSEMGNIQGEINRWYRDNPQKSGP